MGETTGISWTDHTFNPWWGCVKVSPACASCYADAFDRRTGGKHWGKDARRRFFTEKHWTEPLKWNRTAEAEGVRSRVFCASMADVLETLPQGHPDEEQLEQSRRKLAATVAATPWLDWQFLTKRPQSAPFLFPEWRDGWPVNVWLGTTVEDQLRAEERIGHLLATPVSTRFLSCEPLLGWLQFGRVRAWDPFEWYLRGIDWVIVGGESGSGYRVMDLDCLASIVRECQTTKTPLFVKQDSGRTPGNWGRIPPELRIREFPHPGQPKERGGET